MNLPNLITFGRLLTVPVAVYLLMQSAYLSAFLLFLLAGVSDALDGYLAKRLNQTTELGAILDPLADKALLVGVIRYAGAAGKFCRTGLSFLLSSAICGLSAG